MLESIILSNLIYNDDYVRKVIPFLKSEYFHDKKDQIVFDLINQHIQKYNTSSTRETLYVELSDKNDLNEDLYKECQQVIQNLEIEEKSDPQWLLDQTEKFCQDKALYNAIRSSISILDDKDGKKNKGSIPQLLQDALSISFNTSVGHDFLSDYLHRYDYFNSKQRKIPFDIELLNTITKGGVAKKTLNVIMAGTGVGKSMVMCHMAAANLIAGYKVLYITLEMSEEEVARRIDANVLNMNLDNVYDVSRDNFAAKIQKVTIKTEGNIKIKEYPNGAGSTLHFRSLLNELKIKSNFIPDIIYVDYINICASARVKLGPNVNSYTYIKSISEELRGLGVEFNLPVISATQLNRPGFKNSDPDMDNTSDSFGLPMTVDLMLALITSEELEKLGQILVKQLKNRYSDVAKTRKFVIGVDKDKMRLYSVEQSAQEDIIHDTPVMDNSEFGERLEEEFAQQKYPKKHFQDFQ